MYGTVFSTFPSLVQKIYGTLQSSRITTALYKHHKTFCSSLVLPEDTHPSDGTWRAKSWHPCWRVNGDAFLLNASCGTVQCGLLTCPSLIFFASRWRFVCYDTPPVYQHAVSRFPMIFPDSTDQPIVVTGEEGSYAPHVTSCNTIWW